MHTVPAPTSGAKIDRGPLAGLVTVDITRAVQYVQSCSDMEPDARAQLVDLLRSRAREIEREAERLVSFAVKVVDRTRPRHDELPDEPDELPAHEGYAIHGRRM